MLLRVTAFLVLLGAVVLLLSSCGKEDRQREAVAAIEQAFRFGEVKTKDEVVIRFEGQDLPGTVGGRSVCDLGHTVCTLLIDLWHPVVLIHEVGHAIGLGHVDDPASVMHEAANITLYADEAAGQLAGLCKIHGCKKPVFP